MTRNLPVPPGYTAPLSHRWIWYIGPPAVITWLYRTCIPPRIRSLWGHGSSSHLALRAILAGGGWAAFSFFLSPLLKGKSTDWWMGGPFRMDASWQPHYHKNFRASNPPMDWANPR